MSALADEVLWRRLREAQVVHGDLPADAPEAPWFVRLMLAIAGWIGALFLVGFFGTALEDLVRDAAAQLFLGVLLCGAVALALRAVRHGDLLAQFGFAISLAGQWLLASGLEDALRDPGTVAAAVALQQAILFAAVPGLLHRVWCAASGGYAAAFALGASGLAPYAGPLLLAACALAWLREFEHSRQTSLVRAAGYGLGVAALLASVMHGAWLDEVWFRRPSSSGSGPFWTASVANGLVVVGAAAALLRRERMRLRTAAGALAMMGALIIAAAAAKAPGLAPAVVLLVLGHANGNRVLAALGVLALLAYLSYYYYSLQATLLEKSALLAATGIALLVTRMAMQRLLPGEDDA